MNLIIPMAGRSSRFPGLRPKWMLTHPDGRFMAIAAIAGLRPERFKNIYFVYLREHEQQFHFRKGFEEELADAGLKKKTVMVESGSAYPGSARDRLPGYFKSEDQRSDPDQGFR